MTSVGSSWLLDLNGVVDNKFHNYIVLKDVLVKAAEMGNLTVIDTAGHQFPHQKEDPTQEGGSTVFLLLAESHLSVHSWPEHDKLVIDLFSCGNEDDAERVMQYLSKVIPHDTSVRKKIERGDFQ